jgi:hypothetical protein
MCDQCKQAVMREEWERLEEVAADPKTNCWVTRCRFCGQLWETSAYQPQVSWEITSEEAKAKYPDAYFMSPSVGSIKK